MNVFSAGNGARCYQNWNGICWNREPVAMEKWSNTAPCSCHALMRRIISEGGRRKKTRKQWGRKGKVMERSRGKMRGGKKWAEGECEGLRRVRGRRIVCAVCLAWLTWSQPDGFHEQDLTPDWSALCRHITSSSAPSLHPIIPPFNTSSALSVRTHNFQMICNCHYNFGLPQTVYFIKDCARLLPIFKVDSHRTNSDRWIFMGFEAFTHQEHVMDWKLGNVRAALQLLESWGLSPFSKTIFDISFCDELWFCYWRVESRYLKY